MRTARPGYGLLMAVMGLVAISAIVALAVTPNVAQVRDQWRTEHTLDRLYYLTDSLTSIVRFNDDVGTYPGALSHLSYPITTDQNNLCGTAYTGANVDEWGGRYAGRVFEPGVGTPLPTGMMQDDLTFDAGDLVVTITGVREEQARQLDRKVDGGVDGAPGTAGTTGRVRYTAPDPEGLVTMEWRKMIGAVC